MYSPKRVIVTWPQRHLTSIHLWNSQSCGQSHKLHCSFCRDLYDYFVQSYSQKRFWPFDLQWPWTWVKVTSNLIILVCGLCPTIPLNFINSWSIVLRNPVNKQKDKRTDTCEDTIGYNKSKLLPFLLWRHLSVRSECVHLCYVAEQSPDQQFRIWCKM